MDKTERVRERISGIPDDDYFEVRKRAGWVASDCQHLEYDPDEMAVLTLMMELILQEQGFKHIASDLNQHGFRRRGGGEWNEVSAFNLLPRLIEVGPRMFSTAEWHERRKRIYELLER